MRFLVGQAGQSTAVFAIEGDDAINLTSVDETQ